LDLVGATVDGGAGREERDLLHPWRAGPTDGTPSAPPLRFVKSPARRSSLLAIVPHGAVATGTVPFPRWDRSNIGWE
jgi:hypothetical protein